jgi:SLT domain-containing protein
LLCSAVTVQVDLPGIPPLRQSPGFEPLQETEVDEETARQAQEEQRLIDFYRQAARPEPSVGQQLDLPTFNQEGTRSIQPVQTEEEQAFAELDQQLAEQQPLTRAELEQIEQELDEIMPFTDRGFDLESDEVSPIQQVDEEIEQEIQAEADLQQQIENVSQADDQLRREVAFDLQTEEDQAVDQQIFDETQQQAQTLATNLEGIRNRVERDEDIIRQIDQMESEETTQAVLADDQAVADAESETFQEDITQDPAAGLQELQDARDIEAEMDQPADLTFDLSPETTKKSEVLNGVKVNPDTKRGQEILKQRELEVLKDVMSQYFPEASEVVVLDTTEELKQRENIPADVTGIEGATFRKGDGYVVYLIGENLKGKDLRSAIEKGVKIYHHESIGHAGLMQMLGSRYNDFANKVYKNRQTEIDNFIKNEYPNGLPDDTPVRRASEWLAINFTEQGVEQLGILDTVTAVLRGETSDVGIKRKYQQVYNTLAAGRKPEIVIRPTGRASTETTDAPEPDEETLSQNIFYENYSGEHRFYGKPVPNPTEKQLNQAKEKVKGIKDVDEFLATREKILEDVKPLVEGLSSEQLQLPTNTKANKVRAKLAEFLALRELEMSGQVVVPEQTQQDDMLGYSAPDEAAVSRTEFNLAKKFNTNSAKDTQILDTAIENTRKKLAALDAKIQEANQKDGASDNQLDNLNKLKVRLQALKNIQGEQPQQTSQTPASQPDQTSQETSQQADQDDDVVTLSPMGSFSSNRADSPKMGINVRTDRQAQRSYADLIVDGEKFLESRNTDSLRPYVGQRMAIVRTGEGQAQAIGEVTVGEPQVVNQQQFRALQDLHLVPEGSTFDIQDNGQKYLYPMENPVRYDNPAPVGRGIVARQVNPEASFSSNRQQTPPPNTTGTQQERGLRRALDGLNKAFDPRALVPDREFFEKILQRAKGVQNEYVEAGQKLASVMMEANEAEQKLIYDYMTDRDADPNTIPDRQVRGFIGKQIRKRFNRENPTLREAAVEAKEIIEGIGRDLVRQGLLDPQTFKARSGQYLPRLYLKYLDDNNLFSGAGGSLKVSPQGYLKMMRDIDPLIRTMYLGQIKSPGYLVGQTIMQAGQDVARMDFLKEVAQNKQWVLPSSQVKLNIAKLTNDIIQRNNLGPQLIQEGLPAATRQAVDRNVSPEFLEAEAKRLQDQILPSKPLGSAQRTLVQEIISEYSNLANKARADIPNYAVDKYRQLPNTNRYGDLRGAHVLKEIADVVAGDPFFTNEDSSFKSLERGVATINTLFKWGATAAYPVAWVNNVVSNSAMMAFGGLPIHQNLQYRAKAIKEMATNGSRYQDYKDQGLTLSTFAADELGRLQSNFKTQLTPKDRRIMYDDSWFPNLKSADGYAQVANIFGKIFNGFGNIYQSLEVIDKLALAMYLEDKGANVAGIPFINEDKLTPQEAMREANKWLYDYSDVSPKVRKLRKSLLGAPFLTWTYKTVDRLTRMMGDPKASLRAAAYYGILYAAMSMKMADLDDDERDAFYEGLPDWYRKKGLFAVPMPEKDENDRIQIKDYSYAAPHAFIYQFFNTMFDDRYPIFEAFVDLGFTNHPILQQIIEQSANKNLYTGKPLYSEFDTGGQKAKKALLHFADGVLPQLIAPSGWGKQMLETVSGDPNLLSGLGLDSATLDREGKPKLTPTQILGKADLTGLSQAEFPQSMLDVLTLPLNSPLLFNPANRPANIEDSLKFRRSRIIEELRSDRYRERTAIKQQTTAEGKRQKKLEFLEKRKRLMEGLKKVNRALKNLPDFEKPVRIISVEAVAQ